MSAQLLILANGLTEVKAYQLQVRGAASPQRPTSALLAPRWPLSSPMESIRNVHGPEVWAEIGTRTAAQWAAASLPTTYKVAAQGLEECWWVAKLLLETTVAHGVLFTFNELHRIGFPI